MSETVANVIPAEAVSFILRLQHGWGARRDGLGFLRWHRDGVWEPMTEGEGLVWHAANDAEFGRGSD